MSEEKTPRRPRLSFALTLGRMAGDVTQKELSELSGGLDISALEKKREPDRETLDKLYSVMGREPEDVDLALFCADLLREPDSSGVPVSPLEPTREEVRTFRLAAALEAQAVFHVTLEEMAQALREQRAKDDRNAAEPVFKELMRRPAAERWRRVEEQEIYRTWAVCERMALESERRAAHDADEAVDLARLAVRMAELTPGSGEWRARMGGLCWGFLANARRVKGDFPASDSSFLQSDHLWQAGAVADPGLILDGARLLDLKASLRRHQGRFQESLDLLAQAQAASQSDETTARLLLKKAFTQEQMGDWQGAIDALKQARPLVEALGDLRGCFGLEFNLCVCFCEAGLYPEAEGLLPKVRELALKLSNRLDLLRCRWLRGRLSAGLGKLEDGAAELEYVMGQLVTLGIAFDAAQACLDLSQLYLRQGRSAEVKRLAGQMVAVFKAQRVQHEALAAVILFHRAAEQGKATIELARKLADYLRKAEHRPDLRFQP
ncbi:MAG: tetratricopeptide repeat protein [Acidobacteriota bacterium]